jgi:hypothetical protein
MQNYYRKCSSCKKEIGFGKLYQICEISSCKKHAFCSVNCWNLHNEVMGHKSAGAIEMRAPFTSLIEEETEKLPRRIIVSQNSSSLNNNVPQEILIVASKLKEYIKEKHDLSTSAQVMEVLSDKVRDLVDRASQNAKNEGRKTLMDRDF